MAKPRNDRNQAVTKFCLAMEEHRRSEAGRVRTAKEFVAHFFPYDEAAATDRLFVHIPNDIRGPVLATWGIRGAKAALKDDDEKVRFVVHDALVAGDIDEATFEEGVSPDILVDWIVLAEWWSFWRNGKLTNVAIQKALATARELQLIDDSWFLLNIQGRGGRLKGTDVLCDTLSKDQIVAWVRKVHETGDGSPSGLVSALGWDTILTKTAQDALLFVLDQFARKTGLVTEPAEVKTSAVPTSAEPETARHARLVEGHPTVNAPSDAAALAEADALAAQTKRHDSGGFPVAIPDVPAVDGADDPPSIPHVDVEESPKLAEAREAMMATLLQSEPKSKAAPPSREPWDESEVPAKPSSLEWPEPPPIVATPSNGAEANPSSTPPASLELIEEDVPKAAPPPRVSAPTPPPIPRKGGPIPPRPK